jgi:hypothetical protein
MIYALQIMPFILCIEHMVFDLIIMHCAESLMSIIHDPLGITHDILCIVTYNMLYIMLHELCIANLA